MAEKPVRSNSLEGRVAIVTGASRGIGREIALHLAEKGAKLVVNYAANAEKAIEVASQINNKDQNVVRAITCKADISKAFDVINLFDTAEQAFGRVHILVNNAAIGVSVTNAAIGVPDFKYLADTFEQAWDRTFDVNCKGSFLCSREAANRLVRGGGGRIINLSSQAVGSLTPGYGAYAASKAAVETMTKILAKELRGTKITANCVAPGPVVTDMLLAGMSEAALAASSKASPFERLGEVSDVASLVAFLASDEGEWVNAQVVRVNGGML